MGSRFEMYLNEYDTVFGFIPDLHLDGTPIQIRGENVEVHTFCQMLIEPLQELSYLVFLGDTIDNLKNRKMFSKALAQYHILSKTLDEYNMVPKTLYLQGNHDPPPQYFVWRKPVQVWREVRIALHPYQDVIMCHGSHMGLEPYMNQHMTDEKVEEWRTNLECPVMNKKIRKDDYLIVGHKHDGFLNREANSMGVPAMKTYINSPLQDKLSCIGMFCIGSEDNLYKPHLAIEKPTGYLSF